MTEFKDTAQVKVWNKTLKGLLVTLINHFKEDAYIQTNLIQKLEIKPGNFRGKKIGKIGEKVSNIDEKTATLKYSARKMIF